MALIDNVFLERGLPSGVIRTLTDAELADMHDIVSTYSAWLRQIEIPTLFIDITEGDTINGELRDLARTFLNQTEVQVEGRHFAQEDGPDEIGQALAKWILTTRQSE